MVIEPYMLLAGIHLCSVSGMILALFIWPGFIRLLRYWNDVDCQHVICIQCPCNLPFIWMNVNFAISVWMWSLVHISHMPYTTDIYTLCYTCDVWCLNNDRSIPGIKIILVLWVGHYYTLWREIMACVSVLLCSEGSLDSVIQVCYC